jgi:hypothetical protein
MPPCPEASPWWLVAAGTIVAALVGAIGKLWAELAFARAANASLIAEAEARNDLLEADHKRDLRRVIWGPTDPPSKG